MSQALLVPEYALLMEAKGRGLTQRSPQIYLRRRCWNLRRNKRDPR